MPRGRAGSLLLHDDPRLVPRTFRWHRETGPAYLSPAERVRALDRMVVTAWRRLGSFATRTRTDECRRIAHTTDCALVGAGWRRSQDLRPASAGNDSQRSDACENRLLLHDNGRTA
jgi:hypothetical protein